VRCIIGWSIARLHDLLLDMFTWLANATSKNKTLCRLHEIRLRCYFHEQNDRMSTERGTCAHISTYTCAVLSLLDILSHRRCGNPARVAISWYVIRDARPIDATSSFWWWTLPRLSLSRVPRNFRNRIYYQSWNFHSQIWIFIIYIVKFYNYFHTKIVIISLRLSYLRM